MPETNLQSSSETAPPAKRLRRRGDERGVAIVEASIVSILFFTLLFGVMEFGLAFRDYLTTANITRTGARTASGHGNEAQADYIILQSIKKAAVGKGNGTIDYIVVFNAGSYNAPLATVNPACAAGTPVAGTCNVYTPADWNRPSTDFGCKPAVPSPDLSWCPTTRKISASVASGGPPDYIGVYVKFTHNNIFKILKPQFVFRDQTIIRIEPLQP
jgi:hypothetical protein